MDRLLKSTQVAEILGCNRDTALLLMGQMRHMDISGGHHLRRELRVWEADLMAWLKSREETPMAPRKRGRKPNRTQGSGPKLIPYKKTAV